MKAPIIFIHGMFLNGKSWDNWVRFFEARGYDCEAPSWPYHDGEPRNLRSGPPAPLGGLTMEDLIRHYSAIIARLPEKPILIGHSLGGLVAQELMSRHRAAAAVAICSVAPNCMASCDWGFIRMVASVTNPFAGNSVSRMTQEKFHAEFANTLTREESDKLLSNLPCMKAATSCGMHSVMTAIWMSSCRMSRFSLSLRKKTRSSRTRSVAVMQRPMKMPQVSPASLSSRSGAT
ncbi:MAG: alpha/beta fold hydrolase [Luteolibacter sp.]